jgi:AcrB/AcrD/AcrF family
MSSSHRRPRPDPASPSLRRKHAMGSHASMQSQSDTGRAGVALWCNGVGRRSLVNVPLHWRSTLPLFWIFHLNLNLSASVSFIALLGVAALNGVVLVSSINQLKDKGASLRHVVLLGAGRHLRLVLMTALVASLGVVPWLFHFNWSRVQWTPGDRRNWRTDQFNLDDFNFCCPHSTIGSIDPLNHDRDLTAV